MARNQIKGINIEIGGNTKPLDKALGDVNSKTAKLQSELREVEKLLKLDPKNTELLAQKQKILGDSIENTGDKLKALRDAEKQVQEQFKKGEVSEEQYRALQREIIKTEQDLKKVEDQAKETNTALSSDKAIGNLKNMGKAAGVAALAIGATAVGLGAAAINSADELQKLSDQTGLSAERLQELQYAGNNLGVELETITGAQAKLTKAMAGAKDGTGAQAEAFAALGISVTDSNGNLRDAKVVMAEAFTALNNVGNETERDALAMQIFGKSAMELNPLIKAGGEELNRLSAEAQNNGSVMSDEAVAGLDAFGDTLDNLKTSILGSFGEALAKLLPDVQSFIDKLIELPDWIRENKTLLTLIGIAIGTVSTAILAYNVSLAAATIATTITTTATTAFAAVLGFITSPIALVVLAIGALVAAGVLLYKNWDVIKQKATEIFSALGTFIGGVFDGVTRTIKTFIEWVVKAISKVKEFFTAKNDAEGETNLSQSPTAGLKGYINGSYADGLPYVPFNGFIAELHKGERVLTAKENSQYGSNVNHTGTIRVEGVNNKGDLMATVDITMSQLRRELRTT